MEAWTVSSPGEAPRLGEQALSAPQKGELTVEVKAAGLNFADLLMIDGKYQEMPPLPFVPGMELAGRVVAVGPGVTSFSEGDRVVAVTGSGAFANALNLPADRCRPIPDTMDDVTAAAFQIAYGTSHLGLTRRARLSKAETLVVLGAAGGVGLTAVEIGAALGAQVIGVARGAQKKEIARKAGAALTFEADPDTLLDALRSSGRVDVVYDAVGGALGEAAMRALAPEGRHLLIGFASGELPRLKPNHMLVKNIDVIGFYWGGYRSFLPSVLNESLETLIGWHGEGRIHPHVSHRVPFSKLPEALNLLKTRRATGKVVLEM